MRQIYAIAKAELSILFYSPIAWLIIIVFSFQGYSSFASFFGELVTRQELIGSAFNITVDLFTNWRSIYPSIQGNLYLFVPLLTMGIMSREYSSGSIKMLYSSPVSDFSIILGKYLSIVIFTVIMMGVVFPLIGFTMFKVDSADLGIMLSGWLGLALLMAAYASIGMFMSTLTSYQVVAAMLTLGLLAFLNSIGSLAQDVLILKDVTYWLSLQGRVDAFIKGLITSEDLFYFLLVIGLFFSLSVIRLQSLKNKYNIATQAGRYILVVIIAVLFGYVSSRPQLILYFDATQIKRNTLTENSQEVLKQIDGKLKITTYVNMADNNCWIGVPRNINKDLKFFNEYIRFKPDISIDYVHYYDEPLMNNGYTAGVTSAEDIARTLSKIYKINFDDLLNPEEIRQKVNLWPEKNSFVRRAQLENGKYTYLRVYDDPSKHPSETEMIGALRRLVIDPPVVTFLTGNGEPDIYKIGDSDYASFSTTLNQRKALINQGYEINNINLESRYNNKIHDKTDIVVVADPKIKLSKTTTFKLIDYIESGGNMLIAIEPDRRDNLMEIIDALDLKLLPGTIVFNNDDFIPTLIPSRLAVFSTELSGYFSLMGPSVAVTMPGAVGLDHKLDNKFEVIPVATTAPFGYWNETETTDFSFGEITLNRAAGEVERVIPTALALTRMVNGKEQRIMVLGDADCLSNVEIGSKRKELDADNSLFAKATFNWLSNENLPVSVSRRPPPDNTIFMTMAGLNVWKIILTWLVPLLLTILGAFICISRTRK